LFVLDLYIIIIIIIIIIILLISPLNVDNAHERILLFSFFFLQNFLVTTSRGEWI